jgi:hypothetical protein
MVACRYEEPVTLLRLAVKAILGHCIWYPFLLVVKCQAEHILDLNPYCQHVHELLIVWTEDASDLLDDKVLTQLHPQHMLIHVLTHRSTCSVSLALATCVCPTSL